MARLDYYEQTWISVLRSDLRIAGTRSLSIAIACIALALTGTPASAQEVISLDAQPLDDQTYVEQPAYVDVTDEQPYQAQPAEPTYVDQGVSSEPSLQATHGSWEIRCISEGDCVMTQMHQRTPDSADAVFTIIKPKGLADESGNAVSTFAEIVVPLGVFLPGGMGLKIDENPAQAAPFERCIAEGCVVRAPISSEMLGQMKAGSTAYVVIFGGPEKPIKVPISLVGFTAAYNSL